MVKPQRLHVGDKVAIISLSSGVLGEPFAAHEVALGEKRLAAFGLVPVYMPNAKRGITFLKNHPEARAADLKQAFQDSSIKGIICAIGGDDTYRTVPYLLDDPDFLAAVESNPKLFIGFSDTTNNHLMLHKLGLQTYYGPAFLTDFAEFANEMLPYTKSWVDELFQPSPNKEIESSPVWYEERTNFGPEQVGTERVSSAETRGFEVLRGGKGGITGTLLGGCIESLYEALAGGRHPGQDKVIQQYALFPSAEQWRGTILFAETSEEKPAPQKLRRMLSALEKAGVFAGTSAVLVGKPQDEQFYEDYKAIWLEVTEAYKLPIMYNLNFGHAAPRCILPYGGKVKVDFDQIKVQLLEPLVA
jgi:muramoyltetrapeptide carboxypeptidase LdcA involved in peptidoglycan recycling